MLEKPHQMIKCNSVSSLLTAWFIIKQSSCKTNIWSLLCNIQLHLSWTGDRTLGLIVHYLKLGMSNRYLVHSFTHSLINWLLYSYIHTFTQSYSHSYSFIDWLISLLIYSLFVFYTLLVQIIYLAFLIVW